MNYILKLSTVICLLFFLPGKCARAVEVSRGYDRSVIYAALAGNDLNTINNILTGLNESSSEDKEAYEGALLMKRAGLLSNASQKLSVFKKGRKKLEAAIEAQAANVEYRFLRLIIQENAPKIVRYRKDLPADSKMILASFDKLAPSLQQVIRNYSKKSKVLNPADLT